MYNRCITKWLFGASTFSEQKVPKTAGFACSITESDCSFPLCSFLSSFFILAQDKKQYLFTEKKASFSGGFALNFVFEALPLCTKRTKKGSGSAAVYREKKKERKKSALKSSAYVKAVKHYLVACRKIHFGGVIVIYVFLQRSFPAEAVTLQIITISLYLFCYASRRSELCLH